jgi:hypothetical protein
MRRRQTWHHPTIAEEIEFVEKGQPTDLGGAKQLAENDK